ncbi:MAG: alpha/beta hydrolase [Deinococcota bacterium]
MTHTFHKIDIDGRILAALEAGEGEPTVVLEAGMGDSYNIWQHIQPALANLTRTISYDRASVGQSQFASDKRTCQDCVQDLASLLRALNINSPIIIVGHSFGGFIGRLFSHTFPDKVCGLMLLDSPHEDVFPALQGTYRACELPAHDITEPDWLTLTRHERAQLLDPSYPDNILNSEGIRLAECYAQMRAIPNLESLPITVVSAGRRCRCRDQGADGVVAEVEVQLEQTWREYQTKLLELSTNTTHIIATQSQHYIHEDEPQLVVDAISKMIAQTR